LCPGTNRAHDDPRNRAVTGDVLSGNPEEVLRGRADAT
jgi:hypothetical protein